MNELIEMCTILCSKENEKKNVNNKGYRILDDVYD